MKPEIQFKRVTCGDIHNFVCYECGFIGKSRFQCGAMDDKGFYLCEECAYKLLGEILQ